MTSGNMPLQGMVATKSETSRTAATVSRASGFGGRSRRSRGWSGTGSSDPEVTPVRLWFTVTLFVSAALLFSVQPMIAKMILPKFGGAPAVWNTCMVFFQAALLAGYGYAHAAATCLGPRRGILLHAGLLLVP